MKQWYTLYTKPKAEYQVATALGERGIQTYLPETEASKAHQVRERRPFFPCYLFVKLDFETAGLSHVQWMPGLRRIVAFGDRPVPLPEGVINLIRRRLDGTKGWPGHDFKPGDTLRITDGPFHGMLAIFDRPTTPAERVQVLLNILGRANRAWIPATDLEKICPKAKAPAPKWPRGTRGHGRRIKNR